MTFIWTVYAVLSKRNRKTRLKSVYSVKRAHMIWTYPTKSKQPYCLLITEIELKDVFACWSVQITSKCDTKRRKHISTFRNSPVSITERLYIIYCHHHLKPKIILDWLRPTSPLCSNNLSTHGCDKMISPALLTAAD